MPEIVLHVGLPKTGTTSIQAALHLSARELAGHGILVPGRDHGDHQRAAYDLIGQRVGGGTGCLWPVPWTVCWRRCAAGPAAEPSCRRRSSVARVRVRYGGWSGPWTVSR